MTCEQCGGGLADALVQFSEAGPAVRLCRLCLDRVLASPEGGKLRVETFTSAQALAKEAVARYRRARFQVLRGGR